MPAKPRKVYQYDYETGEFLGEYDGAPEAAADNYINEASIRHSIKNRDGVVRTPYGKTRFTYELKKCITNGN